MSPESVIPIARPVLDEREADAVKRAILSGWVTQGPEVAAFEREFAASVGATHACAVSNCTTALHLALRAASVGPGDEVITVSYSFVATANSVRYCGAVPVFVDVDPATYNLDPSLIERAVSARTRAILCVHQFGMPCDLAAIVAAGRRLGLPVIEDAACAIGSEILWQGEWQPIGRPHADVACFSFHPRKVITTGDGGMITTSNREWDGKFRLWRHHGMSIPDTTRHDSREVLHEQYTELGYNYRLTDLQAAVGREQLKRLPELIARRRTLAAQYGERLADVPGLGVPQEPLWARTNWQSYAVRLPDAVDQAETMQFMLDRGISTRRGIPCAHRQPVYSREPWSCGSGARACECPGGSCERLRQSEVAEQRTLLLPLYHQMSEAEQDRVAECLAEACGAVRATP